MNLNTLTLLLIGLIAANLPFVSERFLFAIPFKSGFKAFGWRLVEWFAIYGAVGALAYFLEAKMGPVHQQKWEFYAVTLCLFLVFAYPGFVYRYFWRQRLN